MDEVKIPVALVNPAEDAATQALHQIYAAIDERKDFILEAGAGAGKTYSLIKALNYLIEKEGAKLIRQHQKIACITFTNVAKAQIEARTDGHPAVFTETIHSFCWSLISGFQVEMQAILPEIGTWTEKLQESAITDLAHRIIHYDLGYASIDDDYIYLQHNDVLEIIVRFVQNKKFRNIFVNRYPVLFIDEYQDTYTDFVDAIKTHFIGEQPPLVGFFGDHWQKIYGNGCGKIEHTELKTIDKNSNFRSVNTIVNVLNKIRPELPQFPEDSESVGIAAVYHTNAWVGPRQTGQHWGGDLPASAAHQYLEQLKQSLTDQGWDFSSDKTKILMLTHNVLASEQGYQNFARVFPYNDLFIKKQDKHVEYFVDILEPICLAYQDNKYGQMFSILGGVPAIQSQADKAEWQIIMSELQQLRTTGTVGQVLDYLFENEKIRLSDPVKKREVEFRNFVQEEGIEEPPWMPRLRNLRNVSYSEVIAFARFSNNYTPFATKHSVKGDEFENVLVVVGRGWNQYNFGHMIEWYETGIPAGRQEAFERSRNLFYVSCSRAKTRLAILFTQMLSQNAIRTLENWFGEEMIHPI